MQWNGDKLIPIAFASRTLTNAERRYAQIEKECLASVWACEKFAKYLIGLDRFELQTDKTVVPLVTTKNIDCTPVRGQRLLMRLMKFNAEVKDVPGKHIAIADALSRSPLDHSPSDKGIGEAVSAYTDAVEASWSISSARLDVLKAATVHEAELQQVINYVCNSWPHVVPSHLQAY